MNEQIKDIKRLQEILKQYTGSKNIPHALAYDLQTQQLNMAPMRYINEVVYVAYSRGANTLIFSRQPKLGVNEVTLHTVIPKYIRSAWSDGIDGNIINNLQAHLAAGARIVAGYGGRLRLDFPTHIYHATNETEIIRILSLGFKRFSSYNGSDGYFEM